MIDEPLHFAPFLKSVIWGGDKIAAYKGIDTDRHDIGESWEVSAVEGCVSVVDRGTFAGRTLTDLIGEFGTALLGEDVMRKTGGRFPLLIKLIEARDDLSIQVHPDDKLAMERHHSVGKTEMWHIIDTTPEAKIYLGLKEEITPQEYERRVADNSIMDVIDCYDSKKGDTFFIPAGRIHSIGAGNFLAEIQQSSDITYRIYDYDRRDKDGNTRELHTAEARDAIDYIVEADYRTTPDGDILARCDYFDVRRMELSPRGKALSHERDSFTVVMCLHGAATLDYGDCRSIELAKGDTLLFPASIRHIEARGEGEILSIQA